MTAARKAAGLGARSFDPATGEVLDDLPWSGQRRQFDKQPSKRWFMPIGPIKAAYDAFELLACNGHAGTSQSRRQFPNDRVVQDHFQLEVGFHQHQRRAACRPLWRM